MTTPEPSVEERKAAANRERGDVRRQYAVADIEVRAPADGETVANFYGHASVTGLGYDMYGGPDKGGWTEFIDPGAFKRTLAQKPDVAFLVNHEGMTLARTKAGTLTLAEDEVGLEVKAQLDTRVSSANDLVVAMERGDIDEMSFAFRVMDQVWLDRDGEEVPWWDLAGIERHIREVSLQKGDVSAVNYGANPFTDAALRSLELIRGIGAEDMTPDEIRDAIAHFESLLPADEADERDETPAIHPDDAALLIENDRRLAAWRAEGLLIPS